MVTHVIDTKYAKEEIKGKDTFGKGAQYPTLAELPQGVAAEVNGVEIPESQITNFIMGMRETLGLEDQEAWDQWMLEKRFSTETLRNHVILYYMNNEIIEQMADELDVQPTEEDYQATRESIFYSPEATAALEQALAEEGKTLEDYEPDIVMETKKRMIISKCNEGVTSTPEFTEAVLESIKAEYPEYENAESLDEIDPEIVEQVFNDSKEYSDQMAFSEYLKKFVEGDAAVFSALPSGLPYQSAADAYFAQEYFKGSLAQSLKKSGLDVSEGTFLGDLLALDDPS